MSEAPVNDTTGTGSDGDRARAREEVLRRLRARRGPDQDLARVSREEPNPLSFAQRRLWVLDQMIPGRTDYNSALALDLRGNLDEDALRRALTALVHRHESLRTTLVEVDGEGHQVIGDPFEVDFVRVRVPDADDDHSARLIAREYARPFDLTTGPLLRVLLLTASADHNVLVVCLHHVITDGWSLGIFQDELDHLYRAACEAPHQGPAQLSSSLGELPAQYVDYAAWQRERLDGTAFDRSVTYWRERLTQAPVLDLPTDRPRPATRGTRGDSLPFTLDPALVRPLEHLAGRHNANLFMVLMTAVQVTLSRWSRSEDIVLGTVTAGRDDQRLHRIMGFFVNTLAIRQTVDESLSFGALLERTRAGFLSDLDHSEVPFDTVVDAVLTERDPAIPPLVQAAVVYQNAAGGTRDRGRLGDLTATPLPIRREQSIFDLTLEFHPGPDGVTGTAEFDTDLFDRDTVGRIVDDLRRVLESATDHRPLRTLPLIGPDPQKQIQTAGRGPSGPEPRTFPEMLLAQADLRPHAPALVDAERTVTFRELGERAARIAGHLRSQGVRRGDRVGVCVERDTRQGEVLLGIMYAGAVYLPLDAEYPAQRLAHMVRDAAPRVVVVDQATREAPLPEGTPLLSLAEDVLDVAEPWLERISPADPAYMIYTSGSTGLPKGVVVPHHGLAALATTQGERMDVGPNSRMLQFASPSFDAAIAELAVALLNGGSSILLPRESLRGEGLTDALHRYGISHVTLPPALLPGLEPDDLGPVEHLLVAGEACPGELVDRFSRKRRMYNAYGPTESTVCATISAPLSGAGTPPLGGTVAGTRLYVLDRWLRPVPDGVPGELHIAGDGLAHGYWNRPGLTSGRFVADPFAASGGRMYRSGDVVRRHRGRLEFLGRTDDQVKIRGHRIELGEIEGVLNSLPSVEQAVVVVDGAGGGQRLVAYVVSAPGHTPTGDDLADGARVLPSYMVPAAFVVLDRIPLTPNGKTDRRALPAVDWAGGSTAEHVEPRSEQERALAEAWCEVLGLDRIGVHDDFFRVGGDSVSGVRVLARAAVLSGTRLPLRALFDRPTVAGLADLLKDGSGVSADPLTRAAHEGPIPLSAAQRRMWFLDQYSPEGAAYNSGGALRLSGRLDVRALRTALDALVLRHESLRTVFPSEDGLPRQVVLEQATAHVEETALDDVAVPEREDRLAELVAEFDSRPFDLAAGPLLRVLLVRVGEDDHVLAIGMHHIITDAWSMSVMIRELGALYGTSRSHPHTRAADLLSVSDLPEVELTYTDYALWQERFHRSEGFEEQLDFWRRTLAGAEPLSLPTDRPRPAQRRGRGATRAFEVSEDVLARVRVLEAEHGLTLFMVLAAATAVTLSRFTGQRDITLGTVTSGRGRTELEGIVGFFVNTIVLRTRVRPEDTGVRLLADVRDTVLSAFEHGDVPFDTVVEATGQERDPSRPTLVQALMVLQNVPGAPWRADGLSASDYTLAREHTQFDLTVEFVEDGARLLGAVEYDTDLFDPATADRIAHLLGAVLGALAEHGRSPVHALEAAPTPTEAEALADWSTGRPGEVLTSVPELFARRVARSPQANALVWGDTEMTYARLDESSSALADRLRELGVRAETPVPLLLERGPHVVTAMLAVLRAGGAYVPIHPDNPPERIGHLLKETSAPCVLTDSVMAVRVPRTQGVTVLDLDAEPTDAPARHPDARTPEPSTVHPDRLAYIMYTSGSTGTPKGVAVTHGDVVRLATDRRWSGRHGQRILFHSSHAFDAATYEIWAPLLTGGTVVVAPPERLDADEFADVVTRYGVTATFVTTALFNLYAAQAPACFSGMVQVITGGETAAPHAMELVRAACPDTTVANAYGPTETTTFVTHHPLTEEDRTPDPVPIGRPLDGTRLHVLDQCLRPVPVGAVGELYIAGVARGYHGRPGLTAERFVADPWSSGERLYRSGDLVRWNNEGRMEYVGRADAQVKLRGFRIEPGEIEATLSRLPEIAQATVQVHHGDSGVRSLVAYAVPAPGARIHPESVTDRLRADLPDYMVPAVVIPLESIPLNANGKVDRRALPEPTTPESDIAVHTPPRGATEIRLARIWAELLGTDRVGRDDNFFTLGGDSILSIQMVSRVRQAGWEITTKDTFLHQTVSDLAATLDLRARSQEHAVAEAPVTGPVPPTPVQRWFFETHPRRPEYFDMSLLFEAAPNTDPKLWAHAAEAVLAHHDMLRLRVRTDGPEPHQYLDGARTPERSVRVVDVSPADPTALERAVEREAGRERPRSRLTDGPLFETVVFDAGPDLAPRVLLSAHHLVVDGVSWRIILEDLVTAYGRLGEGLPVDLGAKTTPFPVWADRLTEFTAQGGFETEAAHWAALAERGDDATIPVDLNTGPNDVASQRVIVSELESEETDLLLRRVPGALRGRIDDVLLAVLGRTLTAWSGVPRLLVAKEGHGREELFDDVDLSRTVGWFTTIYPVLLELPEEQDPARAVTSVKKALRAAPDGIGFGALRHLGPERSSAPLTALTRIPVTFNYLGRFGDHGGGDLIDRFLEVPAGDHAPEEERTGLLDVTGSVTDDRLEFSWTYSEHRHRPETVRALAEAFTSGLRELVDTVGRRPRGRARRERSDRD